MTTGYHCSVWDGFSTRSIEGSGGDEEGVGQDGEVRTWAGVWTSGGWTMSGPRVCVTLGSLGGVVGVRRGDEASSSEG